jgi:hypothetical protein
MRSICDPTRIGRRTIAPSPTLEERGLLVKKQEGRWRSPVCYRYPDLLSRPKAAGSTRPFLSRPFLAPTPCHSSALSQTTVYEAG